MLVAAVLAAAVVPSVIDWLQQTDVPRGSALASDQQSDARLEWDPHLDWESQ
jgi:hypothetical protein